MVERLELAPRVAWVKYKNGWPILVLEREAESLAALTAQGGAAGVSAEGIDEFFGAQTRASRIAQAELVRTWSRGGELPSYRPESLADDLRPEMDRINVALLREFSGVAGLGEAERETLARQAITAIRDAGFSRAAAGAAADWELGP